ncbi:mechanosensitive ion channel family protein [Oscillatoria sp. CS-180]|uniref:mechanosensitive ion channel family protein n=1 Tax=Oscillatoria sp. CS-180 TaxID=3021720 RepID=UPI0023313FDD|nr:mechanosensitive ion channel family protein [Oscillatoria sp. CS-180]MDB9527513.1 mechanosensitive ion channel family protein [Oscillatoria sp. CS-180]
MLWHLLPYTVGTRAFVITGLLIAALGTSLLYFILFSVLRSLFRRLENDLPLVTLNVSAYPALACFLLLSLKVTFLRLKTIDGIDDFERLLTAGLIIALSYWLVQIFEQVVVYYLKEFTQQSEVMWDDVLLPLLEAVVPVVVILLSGALVLNSFGLDLTGIWVTLGGATFVIGFAVKDILANFFSGVVLLIDTPFQFGDVLKLEDGSVGMLRRIGVRVTQLYMFDNHCDMYIPNSVLQGQNITNLSRPTTYYHYSTVAEVPFEQDLDQLKQVMREIALAHPDTLGNLDDKLELMEGYFHPSETEPLLADQQIIGRKRLEAENDVNFKLEEIDLELSSIVVTLQFAEKGGLTQDEIENIQMEYETVLQSIGLAHTEESGSRTEENFEETQEDDTLLELIRTWYRISIRDPNLLDDDEDIIPEDWERRITLLKRRVQRLYQKIARPEREETRLDDYVLELRQWLKDRFKTPRKKWQEPQVLISDLQHDDEGNAYLTFRLNFFVDDIKLENGKRGDRISSQIYQEMMRYLKQADAVEAIPDSPSPISFNDLA